MALTDRASVKLHLNIPSSNTNEDSRLDQFIVQVDKCLKNLLQRDIEQASYTEFYTGAGTKYLVLRQRPVVSIANLWVDPAGYFGESATPFQSNTLLTQGVDYALALDEGSQSRSGLVVRIGTFWPEIDLLRRPGILAIEGGPAFGNIKVQYTAGYGTVPADLQLLANQIVAQVRNSAKRGGLPVASESLADYSYSLAQQATGAVLQAGTNQQIVSKYKERAL